MSNDDERDHAEEAYNRATDRETYGEPQPATYKFDMAGIATLDIITAHGPDAARQAADSIEAYEPGSATVDANPDAPDVKFTLTCFAPRSRAYLVEASPEPDNGSDTSVTDAPIPIPIDGDNRDVLKSELDTAIEALEGDSNDAEHDALYGLASMVAAALGVEFDPRAPGDFDDEAETEADDADLSRIESGPCNR